MRTNLNKIFTNQSDLADMEFKSSSLQQSAQGFSNEARRLERQARMRRNRLYLLMGAMAIAFILFIYLFS